MREPKNDVLQVDSRTDYLSSLDGQITSDFQKSCQAPESKIFRFRGRANQCFESSRLARQEGRLAIVTNARRDAVDVDAPLTNGAEAYGEVVWSRRPDAGVKFADSSASDGGKKARSPRRARSKP
jgi:hypothetical protein